MRFAGPGAPFSPLGFLQTVTGPWRGAGQDRDSMQGSPRPHVPCPAGSAVSRGTGLGQDDRRRSHPREGSGRGRGRAVANRPQPCARPAAVQGPAGSLASARRLRSAWRVQGARAHERHGDPRPLTARFAQGGPPGLSCGDGHGVRAPRVRPTCCPQTHFGRLSHHCWPPSDHDKWRGIPNPASRALGLGLHPTEEPSSDSKPPPSVRTEARGQPRRHLGKRHVLHGPLDSEPGVSRGDGGLWRSFQPEHPKRLRLGAGVRGLVYFTKEITSSKKASFGVFGGEGMVLFFKLKPL